MRDAYGWRQNECTEDLVKNGEVIIKKIANELVTGMLITSKELEREYCYNTGIIEGVTRMLKEIEGMKDEY